MLPASHRLRSAQEIKQALATGKWYRNSFVQICFASDSSSELKIACVVGKKVSLSAVKRHRYQRWLRIAALTEIVQSPRTFNGRIVLIANPDIVKLDLSSISKQINLLLKSISDV